MRPFFVCVTLHSFTKLWVLWRLLLDRRGAELTSLTPYAYQAPMSKVTPITNGGFHFFDWTQVFRLQSLCSLLVSVFLLIENQQWNKCSLSVALHLVKKKFIYCVPGMWQALRLPTDKWETSVLSFTELSLAGRWADVSGWISPETDLQARLWKQVTYWGPSLVPQW